MTRAKIVAEKAPRRWAKRVEAARYQGVSLKTVQRQLGRGDLTRYRVGRLVRIDLDEVDRMLDASAERLVS